MERSPGVSAQRLSQLEARIEMTIELIHAQEARLNAGCRAVQPTSIELLATLRSSLEVLQDFRRVILKATASRRR
ncbi:hypothetical protein BURK_009316 [Burkholderia sp. SJ98]|nr:hypothetical protein BURK_009316 [Burkholderia sp. SJ98]